VVGINEDVGIEDGREEVVGGEEEVGMEEGKEEGAADKVGN